MKVNEEKISFCVGIKLYIYREQKKKNREKNIKKDKNWNKSGWKLFMNWKKKRGSNKNTEELKHEWINYK